VKKNAQGTGRAVFPGSLECELSLTQRCEHGAGQECEAARLSGRRRSARPIPEREPVWIGPTRAVLIGANVLLREGLARILAAAGFRIIASAPCVDDHVLSTLRQGQSILLIIDSSDDFDAGLRQIACFKQRYPAGRVVVLADQHQLTKMVSAFRTGANAYLVKVATCETFVKSLELVMLGVTLLPPEILNLISDRQASGRNDRTVGVADDGHTDDDDEIIGTDVETTKPAAGADSGHGPRLSACQQTILRGLAEGSSNKTIARKIAMAESTVKVHVKAILRKIRVRNRTQAAIWAMSNHPLIPTKDESPFASEELPVELSPDLDATRDLSEPYRNGSTSLAEIGEVSQITMPGHLRLVRKSD
jgi:two-component system, NarL family, nitrate/nitrite response regulator NarL